MPKTIDMVPPGYAGEAGNSVSVTPDMENHYLRLGWRRRESPAEAAPAIPQEDAPATSRPGRRRTRS